MAGAGRLSISFLAIALAVLFAVRDLIGFHEDFPLTYLSYTWIDHVRGFVNLLTLAVAATILTKSRDANGRTLATALIGLSLNNNWWFLSREDPWLWPSVALNYVGIGFGVAQALRFAATIGSGDFYGRGLLARAALPVGIWVAGFGSLWWLSLLVAEDARAVFNQLFWYGWDVANGLIILALLTAWFAAPRSERRPLFGMAAGVLIAALATAVHGFERTYHGESDWVNAVDTIGQVALPVGLGYGVLIHRIFSIDLATRTLLYSVLAVLLCTTEFFSEKLFHALGIIPESDQSGVTLGQFAVALIVTLSYRRIDAWVDRRAERLFPPESCEKRRTIAALREFFKGVWSISDAATIHKRLLSVLQATTASQIVAVYEEDHGGGFRREGTGPNRLPAFVPATDFVLDAILRRRPCSVNEPRSALYGFRAYPMSENTRVRAFVVCEARRGPIDAEADEALFDMIRAAGAALADIRDECDRKRISDLEALPPNRLSGGARSPKGAHASRRQKRRRR